MPKFKVTVEGANYAVEAPDENTAWKWANVTHKQAVAEAPAAEQPQTTKIGGLSKTPFNMPDFGPMAYNAGGAVTDFTGSPALGYATNVGIQAIPTVAGSFLGSKAAPALRSGGESLMRMALKPSTTLGPKKSAAAVKTMLTADVGNILPGANVTPKGINQLSTKQQALAKQIERELGQSNATVNKFDVAKSADSALQKATNQVTNVSDRNAVLSSIDEFLNKNPLVPSRVPAKTIPPQTVQSQVLGPNGQPFTSTVPGITIPASGTNEIPIAVAQQLKKGTYANLGDKAYKGTELKSAEVNAQKALARGLRKEIEKKVPSVGPLNAEESQLINAATAAISRNAVAGNKDPLALSLLANSPEALVAFMANRSERVKSLLARLLYSGANPISTGTGAAAGALYGQQGQQP